MPTSGGGGGGGQRLWPGVFRAFARSYAYLRTYLGGSVETVTRALTGGSYIVPGGDVREFNNPQARRVAEDAGRIYRSRFAPFMSGTESSRLSRNDHIRAETPSKFDTPYRYTVVATWERAADEQQFRTYINDASTRLSVKDIRDWIADLVPQALRGQAESPGLPGLVFEGWHVVNIDLVMAERRT